MYRNLNMDIARHVFGWSYVGTKEGQRTNWILVPPTYDPEDPIDYHGPVDQIVPNYTEDDRWLSVAMLVVREHVSRLLADSSSDKSEATYEVLSLAKDLGLLDSVTSTMDEL